MNTRDFQFSRRRLILAQYAAFSRIYRNNTKQYGRTETAVIQTVNQCISQDILKDYFIRKRTEVIGLMLALFDSQEVQNMYEESIKEEGSEEGRFCIITGAVFWRNPMKGNQDEVRGQHDI